jgi:hypothetical protein
MATGGQELPIPSLKLAKIPFLAELIRFDAFLQNALQISTNSVWGMRSI